MEEQSVTFLLQTVNTVGVVGLLIFIVMAFYRGDLISKVILDRILQVYECQMQEMTERIMKRLEEVVQETSSQ